MTVTVCSVATTNLLVNWSGQHRPVPQESNHCQPFPSRAKLTRPRCQPAATAAIAASITVLTDGGTALTHDWCSKCKVYPSCQLYLTLLSRTAAPWLPLPGEIFLNSAPSLRCCGSLSLYAPGGMHPMRKDRSQGNPPLHGRMSSSTSIAQMAASMLD